MGAGTGSGGGARHGSCARGPEGDGVQDPTAPERRPTPPWPGCLPGEVLADTGALPLARGSAIRSAGPAGGLLRVWGRGARGLGQDDRPRSPNALGARQLVATPHGRGPDKPAGRGNYHGEVDLELGHLTRFDTTCQLVSFLRLASSEHSSGSRRR